MTLPSTQELTRLLDKTKVKLFVGTQAAFLTPLLCTLDFHWSDEAPTSWTDGTAIYWNPVDFMGCTEDGRVSTLLHEVQHVFRMHQFRAGNRDMETWNQACDIVINRDLLANGYKLEWLYPGMDPCYHIPHELEEDIYDWLIQNQQGGCPLPAPSGQCCGGFPKPASPTAQQQVLATVVQAMHSAVMAGKPGAIPGSLTTYIEQFFAPKVNWEERLMKWFTDQLEEDYTYRRPNRRIQDIYLPSRFMDDGRLRHIICYQDVSGSVTDTQSTRFNSELKYIWEHLKPEKLTIVQFDTRIQKVDELKEGDPFTKVEILGRGGTSLVPVRQHILDNQPTAAIIFSDMDVDPMKKGPQCPILWVALTNNKVQVPFGEIIYIDE